VQLQARKILNNLLQLGDEARDEQQKLAWGRTHGKRTQNHFRFQSHPDNITPYFMYKKKHPSVICRFKRATAQTTRRQKQ
jgi:hypothetical protein